MVNDPVCGMTVSEGTAMAKSVYQRQTYYFCSTPCTEMFEREPQEYILPHGGMHL